ncbi:response receiver sensor diguanylate cyclase, PAS domain-containing [Desulfuromonas sp. DDH964]|nr:response receiver sensor diguanylate cyclase, PAS domain-containing [Desulfuromonas sp. DDH964]
MKKGVVIRQKLFARLNKIHRSASAAAGLAADKGPAEPSEGDLQSLVHTLEVHQLELEMQNQELQQAQAELLLSRDKYAELYDFAPVGYFTLDAQGRILEVNLAGAKLLRKDRQALTGLSLAEFIADEEGKKVFSKHLEAVLQRQEVAKCEIKFKGRYGTTIHGQVQSVAAEKTKDGAGVILASIVDDTTGKHLEREVQEGREYAENIVETVREPLVVLSSDLQILTANHSFYETFKVTPEETISHFIYDIGNRQWDIPGLRVLVEEILPLDTVINDYEVEHDFPEIGRKTILLNARQIFREEIGSHIILLAMEDITKRKQLEREIQTAREYAENIVETVREPLVVLGFDLKILTANHSFYATFGVTPEKTVGHFIYDVGNRQWDIPGLRVLVEEILPLDTVINDYEVEHDFPEIGRKTILLNARQIFREEISSRIILLAMEDITERKLAEKRLADVFRQQQAILDNIPNIAWLKDREGSYVAVNAPFSRAYGVAPQELFGKNDFDIFPPELATNYARDFREVMTTGKRTSFEETLVDPEGKTRHVEKVKTPIFNDAGEVIGIIGIVYDITESKETEASLRYESTHDALTGLYNRAFFDEELERLARGRKFPLSIVTADVNGLKKINDTLGHPAGDKLIQLAARVILEGFRADDIVARTGGDEFVVLLPATDCAVAETAVARIRHSPEFRNGLVAIAFGIACAGNEEQLAEALKLSDGRMYQDKSSQKELPEKGPGEDS